METSYCTAIVLAAGRGNRMGTKVHKQYLLLAGKPVVCYSLQVFQRSEIIDEIILVAGEGEEEYCRENFVEKYGITKVSRILTGGKERFHSVWNGLRETREDGYIFIHDAARPFVDEEMLARLYETVRIHKACVAGMPVKDTIKVVDSECNVEATPDRSTLWMVQTPQVFEAKLVKKAYRMLMEEQEESCICPAGTDESRPGKDTRKTFNHACPNGTGEPRPGKDTRKTSGHTCPGRAGGIRPIQHSITDDAGVVEEMLGHPVKLVKGSYENIKITTPDDLEVGAVFAGRGNS